MRQATPTLTIPDSAFTLQHMPVGRQRVGRRRRRTRRDREGHGRLHLGPPDAAHAAVLHERPDPLQGVVDDEEREQVPMKSAFAVRLHSLSERGQSMLEFALVLPLAARAWCSAWSRSSYALLDQHVVTKLTREGSNLISRDTSLQDAATAMRSMSTRPVDFNGELEGDLLGDQERRRRPARPTTTRPILYQRYEYGAISGASALSTGGRLVRPGAGLHRRPTPTPTPACRSPTCRATSPCPAAECSTSPRSSRSTR